jgi:nitrogen fixation-related uncharacterized protein
MERVMHRSLLLLLISAGVAPAAEGGEQATATDAPAAPVQEQRKPPGGWRVVMRGQTVYWCTKQQQFGSRTRSEERCLTPEQYDDLQEASKDIVEDIRRASPPPKGG